MQQHKATGVRASPSENLPIQVASSLGTHVCRIFLRRVFLVLFLHRRNVSSGAPLDKQWIRAKALAQAFDVLVQSVPKFDEYRADLLVVSLGEKFGAQSANSIFQTKHRAPVPDGAVAPQ